MASRFRKLLLFVLAVAVLLAGGAAAAWARYDLREGRVGRNVTLAGQPVGGVPQEQLVAAVQDLATRYSDTPVEVRASGGGFVTTTKTLGAAVQVGPTVQAIMALDREGPALDRVIGWIRSFLQPRPAPLAVSVDTPSVYRTVAAQDSGPRTPAREPTIREAGGQLQPVEGVPGRGIDPADVIRGLPEALSRGMPVRVEVERGSVAPRFSLREAAELARAGEAATAGGLDVKVGNQIGTVPPETLRASVGSKATDTGLQLTVDERAATAGLAKLFPTPDPPPKNASFTVINDQVTIVPGEPGRGCCADAAGGVVARAVLSRARQRVDLPLREVEPEVTAVDLSLLGIRELVGTFTTNHAGGQPRVNNIHLIADMVRGQIVRPGEMFSVNQFVGERTKEKGFVVAPVIQDGKFEESVGGGISQFATTMFNAAFFAGLDFPEYQSHSIYISRYPYGREATLGYPKPDLQIRNPSPFAILIWTSYTDRSITVSLYSTKWVEAAQTGQTEEPRGACKLVRTERTRRVLADGSILVDRVNALYRPAEGVNCR